MADRRRGVLKMTPHEAAQAARADGDASALRTLDAVLRQRGLQFLQDRSVDRAALEAGLIEAIELAEDLNDLERLWGWRYLLGLVRAAARAGSVAERLKALPQGRAGELFQHLVLLDEPCQPSELAASLEMKPQQVSSLLSKLEGVGLILRRKGSGRATWVLLSPSGRDLAASLPSAPPAPEHTTRCDPWDPERLNAEVLIH
jgi:DNA-binding transcriptional ArsR family regulator